jgi:hypothetical protein
MFDEDLSFTIEQRYPYPIAVAFRRLETDEYSEAGPLRLKGLLEVAERTIHALALIVMSDVVARRGDDGTAALPAVFEDDFARRFAALSFGTMVQVLREGTRWLSEKAFVTELAGYLFDEEGKPGEALRAIEELNAIRNRLAHPTQEPTRKEIVDSCEVSESAVAAVLQGLDFITGYELLSVNQIEVIKPRDRDAEFRHRFSRIVGVSESFKSKEDRFDRFMESHAVIVKRRKAFDYLNLSPLVIYSTEGEKGVPDIFMYSRSKGAGYVYAACHNGGTFDSRDTTLQERLAEEFAVVAGLLSGEVA